MTDKELLRRVDALEPWLIELRRALHQCPEPGFQELETQALILKTLDALGIPTTTNRTWVIGRIEGGKPGKTVALRADVDALPVLEPDSCPFRSRNEGYMHACGHDAHTAILLGVARLLGEVRQALCGSVVLLFQPAEETDGGALPMVESGAMRGVDEVFGLHVQPYLPVGAIETRAGTLNASTDGLKITIEGKSGHGAYPDQGADAILAAAQAVTALHTVVSRNVSPLQSAVISIGQIRGGQASNILCGEVTMQGTIRAATPEVRALLHRRAKEAAEGAARAMGCEAKVEIQEGYCPLVNDETCAQRVLDTAARLLGTNSARVKQAPSMGGEDFGYFNREAPGAFYHIGCTPPGKSGFAPLHSAGFSLDEGCLKIGVAMQAALVMDVLCNR